MYTASWSLQLFTGRQGLVSVLIQMILHVGRKASVPVDAPIKESKAVFKEEPIIF